MGYLRFGKKKAAMLALPSPDVASSVTSFGRYLRYGRKSAFGRRYFGFGADSCGSKYPQFGKKKKVSSYEEDTEEGENEFGKRRRLSFGKKKKKKTKRIPKALRKVCAYYKIKTTRKVGKRRVQRSVKVLKKLVKAKMKGTKFGARHRASLFGKKKKVAGYIESGVSEGENEFGGVITDALKRGFGKESGNTMFGKKKKKTRSKGIPKSLRKVCAYYKIKTTRKVGNRRVQRSVKVLKKLVNAKMRSSKFGMKRRKSRSTSGKRRRRTRRRRTLFGNRQRISMFGLKF